MTTTIINGKVQREALLKNFLAVTHYRLATEEDIKDGVEMLMVDVSKEEMLINYTTPTIWGIIIKLDSPAIQQSTVYYHCIKPVWERQCFVPLSRFLSGGKCLGPEYRYIVPSANQRTNNRQQNHMNREGSKSAIPEAILQGAEVELINSISTAKYLVTLGHLKEAFTLAFDSYSKASKLGINLPDELEILKLFKSEVDKLIKAIAVISGDSFEKRQLEKEVMSIAEIVEVFEKGYLKQTSERVSKAKSPTAIGDNLRIPVKH